MFATKSRQKSGKISAGRGNHAKKLRQNILVNQNVVCCEFAATFCKLLQNKFRDKLWENLMNTLSG
jgi:hypothetical protein